MSDDPAFESLLLIVRRWRVVVAFAALGGALATTYALVAPEWFQATLTVVPSRTSTDSTMLSLASKISGIETGPTNSQRIEAVLNSNSVADEVITKFKLTDRYSAAHIEDAREKLRAHCVTSADRDSGIVSLTCEDHDPKVAKDMTAYFGEVGNQVFRRVEKSSASEEEKFLETQVEKARNDVVEASVKLRDFQEKYKIIDLPEQTKAVISAMASIQGDLISKQLELSYLTSFSARTESSVVQLQQQIAVSNEKLHELEVTVGATTVGTGSGSAGFFPGAMKVPDLRFQLEQLLRDQKTQEAVLLLVTQRYELAKVESARNTSTFEILDNPTLPTKHSRPKRIKTVMLGVAAGIALACVWIIAPVWWRRRRAAIA